MPKKLSTDRRHKALSSLVRENGPPSKSHKRQSEPFMRSLSNKQSGIIKLLWHFMTVIDAAFKEFGLNKNDPEHRFILLALLAATLYSRNRRGRPRTWTTAKLRKISEDLKTLRSDDRRKLITEIAHSLNVTSGALEKQLQLRAAKEARKAASKGGGRS